MFERLKKTSYPEQVANKIRDLIVEQRLGPSARLPSERDMADQFGVSRSSIREGIKLLAARGLVEIRIGDGTYVSQDLTTSVIQPITWAFSMVDADLAEFVEYRMLIEPNIAALAALRADEKDKEQMLETIYRLEESIGQSDQVVEADMDFHLVIAASVRNQLVFETILALQRLLRPLLFNNPLDLDFQERSLKEHKEIYEAIQRGDAAAAREVMARSIAKDRELEILDLVIQEG